MFNGEDEQEAIDRLQGGGGGGGIEPRTGEIGRSWQWRSQPENSPRADSYSKIFATNDSLHVLSKNGRTTNKNQDITF